MAADDGSTSHGPPRRRLGYCTNVHAGTTLAQTRANLQQHAIAVRRLLDPQGKLGIGLWLPATAARELCMHGADGGAELAAWLAAQGLEVFTINGFPWGNFHDAVVRHEVYRPTWCDVERKRYTLDLAEILATLVEPGGEGSISTLPIGWAAEVGDDRQQRAAATLLRQTAAALADLERRSGRLIHLNLEPEPGCLLQRAEDVCRFFEQHLLGDDDEPTVRRHLRVCHDVCHAAVMFEDQAQVFAAYRDAGVSIGKVQLSSAIEAPFDRLDGAGRRAALAELEGFRERRYLHQTCAGDAGHFFEDLPDALAAAPPEPDRPWRVHFHVPLFLERFGALRTTSGEIVRCMALLEERGHGATCPEADGGGVRHFEAETYAWDVLPAALQAGSLAEGIARELRWVLDVAPPGFFA